MCFAHKIFIKANISLCMIPEFCFAFLLVYQQLKKRTVLIKNCPFI